VGGVDFYSIKVFCKKSESNESVSIVLFFLDFVFMNITMVTENSHCFESNLAVDNDCCEQMTRDHHQIHGLRRFVQFYVKSLHR